MVMTTDRPDAVRVGLALGSTTRMQILSAVADSPMTITELAEATGIHQTTASYHCGLLAEAGLIRVQAAGTRRYVYLGAREVRIPLRREVGRSDLRHVRP